MNIQLIQARMANQFQFYKEVVYTKTYKIFTRRCDKEKYIINCCFQA